jgi:hypothetical protein
VNALPLWETWGLLGWRGESGHLLEQCCDTPSTRQESPHLILSSTMPWMSSPHHIQYAVTQKWCCGRVAAWELSQGLAEQQDWRHTRGPGWPRLTLFPCQLTSVVEVWPFGEGEGPKVPVLKFLLMRFSLRVGKEGN